MDHNPYQAPSTVAAPSTLDFDELMRRDLRTIAKTQKAIIICIAANLALLPLAIILRETPIFMLLRLAAIGLTGLQLWAVAVLSSKLYGRGIAVFATLGMFIPCFSLVVLLMLSQAATKKLRDAGVRVGLFGANPSELP